MNIFQQLQANRRHIRAAKFIAKAIEHKLRLDILEVLQEKGRATVTEIFTALRLDQSVTSQHLSILRKSKVVKTERAGKFIYYGIDAPVLEYYIKVFGILSDVNPPGRLPGSLYMQHPDELKRHDGPDGPEGSTTAQEEAQTADTGSAPAGEEATK